MHSSLCLDNEHTPGTIGRKIAVRWCAVVTLGNTMSNAKIPISHRVVRNPIAPQRWLRDGDELAFRTLLLLQHTERLRAFQAAVDADDQPAIMPMIHGIGRSAQRLMETGPIIVVELPS